MRRISFNNKQSGSHATYIRRLLKEFIILACIAFALVGKNSKAEASSQINTGELSVSVDYLEEVATINAVSGSSTKYYLSNDGKKTWDLIDPSGSVDISTILQRKETTIYFRGNKDAIPTPITLQAEDSSLKAKYQVISGEGSIILSGTSNPVEYRKGTNGRWKTASSPLSTTIYELKGATLYFRTVATATRRTGLTVSVRISKKPSAPSIKLDGSRLYFTGLKNGLTEYRVGESLIWKTFTPRDPATKTISIMELFGADLLADTPNLGGVVEFRLKPTDTKVASSVNRVEVPSQPIVPTTIALNGTTLSIQDLNVKTAYEYTRVEKGQLLNIATAKWTTITAARSAVIPYTSIGDTIYARLKSTTDSVTKIITPASTIKEFPVTSITLPIRR